MDSQQVRDTIARARAGDAQAFEALFDAYAPRLYGYFLRATRRHHDAEDLLGELTLRMVRKLESYDERGRFEPWLFRMAANLVRDRIRRAKANPVGASLSAGGDDGDPPVNRLADDAPHVSTGLVQAEDSQRLGEAMEQLDEATRQMILMRHFGELSFRELAETFECPLGTALARVHRGLKRLRELMGDDDDDE